MGEPRFQFRLADLLVVTVLIGLGMAICLPLLLRDHAILYYGNPPTHAWSAVAYGAGVFLLGGLLAAIVGLHFVIPKKLEGWRRVSVLVVSQAVVWPLVFAGMSVLWPPRFRGGLTHEGAAINACRLFAEAETIYIRQDWDGDGVFEFAVSISGPFSLLERKAGTGDLQLVDVAIANAEFRPGQPVAAPRAGYIFKVLTAQGPGARGGRKSYFQAGPDGKAHLTGGYALVACPVQYGGTGNDTFIINQEGKVYGRDLGDETRKIFEEMTEYDPAFMGPWEVVE